jgi:hypothetical protein
MLPIPALIAAYGCRACHATDLDGVGGRRTQAQIAAAILHPKAPMPNFGFTAAQANDIAAYLAQAESPTHAPVVTVSPEHPSDYANVTVTFSGMPPKSVRIVALMTMGGMKMHSATVTMASGKDPHVFTGRVNFPMDGTWTLHVVYDGASFDRRIDVGQ